MECGRLKIYTKTGDRGETGLLGGVRVSKDHYCIEICGELDEFNSVLGVAIAGGLPSAVSEVLSEVQRDLFDIGGAVAAALGNSGRRSELRAGRVVALEEKIDQFENGLASLSAFIMPGGGVSGSVLHWSRTVCRRVERRFVSLINGDTEQDFSQGLVYLNRLGDFLFVAARYTNALDGKEETSWLPNPGTD